MTSWLRVPPGRTSRPELDVAFQTDRGSFCKQFLGYFYHIYYARKIGKVAQIVDGPNSIGDDHPLLRTTFADVSGIVASVDAGAAARVSTKVYDSIARTPRETLRLAARDILRLHPGLEAQVAAVAASGGFPQRFDLGVHIRTGSKKGRFDVARWVRAIEEFQTTSRLKSVRVFVMTDDAAVMPALKAKLKGPFEVFSVASELPVGGYKQEAFNALSTEEKFSAYMVLMTELYIMRKIPAVICGLDSSVAKYIWLNAEQPFRYFRSLDTAQEWSP